MSTTAAHPVPPSVDVAPATAPGAPRPTRRRPTLRQVTTGAVLTFSAFCGVISLGYTGVDALAVGDCIASLPDGSISELKTTSCDDPHVAEVVGSSESSPSDDAAVDFCEQAFERYTSPTARPAVVPETYGIEGGGGGVLCLAVGEGLTSSVTARSR